MPKRPQKAKEPALPSWNLADLYASITDPKINETIAACRSKATKFAKAYRAKMQDKNLSAATLASALRSYEELMVEISKPQIYASLLTSADSANTKNGAFKARITNECREVYQDVVFFDLAVSKLDTKTLKKFVQDPKLKKFSHYLEKQALWGPHRLDEELEKILMEFGPTSSGAFKRLFNQEHSLRRYPYHEKKSVRELSEAEISALSHNHDRKTRKQAADGLTAGLKEDIRRNTFITNILAEHKKLEDKRRNFSNPELDRHIDNEIDQDTVDAMSGVVTDNYRLVQAFYRQKRINLKLDKLYEYDRYAPLASSTKTYSYEEGKDLVLTAFHRFSPRFAEIAQLFFDKGWIDAAARPGKRGGAFCQFVTPDLHPYVFLNYLGTLRDVFIMAHELGHAIHAYLAREQNYLHFDMPLTTAETASIFSEMLLFDLLKERITDKKERLALFGMKIEEMFASVFRQTAMYRFEQDLHAAIREHGEQSPEQINAIWLKRQREMFGSSVTLTDDYGYWWSYIPHFIHTPFYVYAYAFGELLTLSLYQRYKEQGDKMITAYMNLLRAGGSQAPEALLEPLGVDVHDKRFWEKGIRVLEDMVNEFKKLS